MAVTGGLAQPYTPQLPPRGQQYTDDSGHIQKWVPAAPNDPWHSSQYVDTGEIDPSFAQSQQTNAAQAEQKREFDATAAAKDRAFQQLQEAMTGAGAGAPTPLAPVQAQQISVPTPGPAGNSAAGPSAYDTSAENAAYAGAKDASAEALAGSLKSLHNTLASRGITGSGIEGKETEALYQQGNETIANTARAQAATQAGHAFTAQEQTQNLQTGANTANANNAQGAAEFNTGTALTQQQLAADNANKKLSSLVSAYGSLY